ncbi:MAG: PAS domain S-box protein, partial [Planctomycetota bacterium]
EDVILGAELQVQRCDGTIIWVRDNARAIRDDNGQVLYYEGSLEDITRFKRAEEELRQHRAHLEELVHERTADLRAATHRLEAELAERQQAEQALSASQERFRAMFAGIPIGLYRTTPDGRVLEANPALINMLGFSSFEELATRNLEEEGFEPRHLRQEFRQRIESRGTITWDNAPWRHRDGSVIYVRENARVVRAADGGVICYEGTVEDVTERRQAEQALRESEESFRAVVAASKDAMVAINSLGAITHFNPAAEKMFGYRAQEMIGQNLDPLMPVEQRAAHRQRVARYFSSRDSHSSLEMTMELLAVRRDGTPFPVELSLSSGRRGAEPFVLAIMRDITARKHAEEELRKFKTITDRASFGAAMADLDGHLIYVNDAFAQMHGYTPAELAGRHLSIFHTPEQLERVNTLNARLAREGQYLAEEVWHKRKDGSVFPAIMNGTLIRDERGDLAYISATAVDISQRVRAQEIIRESEERYRTLVESMGDGVALVTDGKVQYASPSLCRIVERPAEEIIGRSPAELVVPEHARLAAERVQAVLAGEPPGLTPYGLLRPDGEQRYIEVRSSLIHQEGQPALLAVLRDITERRRTQEALRESVELFRTVIAASQDAIIAIDRGGLVTIFNPAAEKMFGRKKEEVIRQPLDLLMPEEHRLRHRQHVKAHFATEAPHGALGQTLELPALRGDGTVFPVELSLSAGQRGTEPFVLAIIRDITKRKRDEEKLKETTALLQSIMDSATEEIIVATDPTGTILSWNEGARKLLGYEAEEVVGRKNIRVFHTKEYVNAGLVDVHIQDMIVTRKPLVEELAYIAKGGRRFSVQQIVTPRFDEDDEFIGMLGMARDITEHKRNEDQRARLEAELREAQKMHAVGQVAAGIAHDFSNLLAVTRGGITRLREQRTPDAETLQVLECTIEEATSITQSLLLFSHRLPAERQTVDLCRLVREALPVLRHLLPASSQLHMSVDCGQPAWVNADPGQLRQVLLNLTINARDAMPSGGELYISVDQSSGPETDTPTALVRLTVRDSGLGIPAEVRPHVFEPFFTTKPGGRGCGLGLATVQSIVRDHGGQIQLASEVNRGTTFTITLPPLAAERARAAGPAQAPPRGRGELILLEENNRHIRRLMNATLCSWGYQVQVPDEGVSAYDIYLAGPDRFALLIFGTDSTPSACDPECVQKLRAAGYSTPVILTTRSMDPHAIPRLDPRTVMLYKPFQMEELGQVLLRLLDTSPTPGAE